MGEGSKDAATRRDIAKSMEERARQDMRAHWESSVRGRHITRVGHLVI